MKASGVAMVPRRMPYLNKKGNKMTIKVNWKELGRQLWNAVKPVLLGLIGGGLVAVTSGCSSFDPQDKSVVMRVVAVGVPGIAVITRSQQTVDNAGADVNSSAQMNPVTTTPNIGK